MPEERVANIIEIIYFISIIGWLEWLLMCYFYYSCRKDSSLEIHSICHINFTKINKIVSTFKLLNRFSHKLDIQVIFSEEIFISSFSTPISCIKFRTHLLAPDNPNVLRKDSIHHITIIHFGSLYLAYLSILLCILLYICSKVQANYIAHRRHSFISPTSSSKRLICWEWARNEA